MTAAELKELNHKLSEDYKELAKGFRSLSEKYFEQEDNPHSELLSNIYKNIAERMFDISFIYAYIAG